MPQYVYLCGCKNLPHYNKQLPLSGHYITKYQPILSQSNWNWLTFNCFVSHLEMAPIEDDEVTVFDDEGHRW